ncbi:hypothetical protein ACRYCC_31195 [Actinomadura scrupuli]|uniref:hypothetical protein n=1 Tax=Actinomadura scrupuli TaxID=559629 RepID=UPI003D99D92F
MITQRGLTALTLALLIAVIAAGLALAAGALWPAALLTGGAAAGGALRLLPKLLRESDNDPDS